MKNLKRAAWLCAIFAASIRQGHTQNALVFTGVNATVENAIQLHWASNTNEVYEVDYADALATNADGSTTWQMLYNDLPSQGTNTFIADCGNYDQVPEIPHPKYSPERFYRVQLIEDNTSPTNPTVSIIYPSGGANLSGQVTMQVAASSPENLTDVRLYVDGEEQWSIGDGSNFVINTCEWPNGNHVLFATAKSQSSLEGVADGGVITYGRSTTPYMNVTFSNLISQFDFSQPFFEPALGETQAVTASFAVDCDWTLQIQDINSNAVRTVTGSGTSMEFDWDGTGDGETNIPDGLYTYNLTATTNGETPEIVSGGGSGGGGSPPVPDLARAGSSGADEEVWAVNGDDAVPLSIYPPSFDTNSLTLVTATPAEVSAARSTSLATTSFTSDDASAYSGASSQSTAGPTRKSKKKNKGTLGTVGILYLEYGTNGFSSAHPTTGWPYPLPTEVAIDGQSATATTVDYRIWSYPKIAADFSTGMAKGGYKTTFLKHDGQWSATDIKKSSLGGNQIFDTVNMGLLLTHGSYATTPEDDNVKYTYVWLGPGQYVRLSDMEFGDSTTLKWMTIHACNILHPANVTSMANNSKLPIGDNLHLLLGVATTGWAVPALGLDYSSNLVANVTVPQSWYNGAISAFAANHIGVTNTVTFRVMGQQNCFSDTITANNPPDDNTAFTIQDQNVYTLP